MNQNNLPKILVTNKGLIFNNNKFLLIKRSSSSSNANKWELPGGKLDEGETLEQNLLREIYEETALNPHILMTGIHVANNFSDLEKYKGDLVISITSLLSSGTHQVELSEEHQDYDWFEFEKIRLMPDLRKDLEKVIHDLSKNNYLMILLKDFRTLSLPNK